MKEKFQALSQRDKTALILGVGISLCYLFYLLVLSPLNSGVERLQNQVSYQQELIAWMKQAQKQISRTPTQKLRKVAEDQLLNVVSKSIAQAKLNKYPHQLRQTAYNSIQLSFKEVPFDRFMSWVLATWKQYQLAMDKLTITRINQEGLVKVSIVFK